MSRALEVFVMAIGVIALWCLFSLSVVVAHNHVHKAFPVEYAAEHQNHAGQSRAGEASE